MKKQDMSGVRFVRINGRVVPIKQTGILSSETIKGSKAKKIIAQQRADSPKERSAARKLMFGAGAAYGMGAMAGGAAAINYKNRPLVRKMGIFGGLSIATAAGLAIASGVKSQRAAEFRIADEGGKGALKNLGNGLGDLAIGVAGVGASVLAVKYGHKLKHAMKAKKKGQTVISKYDVVSKFKAYRAKNVTPKKKPGGMIGK